LIQQHINTVFNLLIPGYHGARECQGSQGALHHLARRNYFVGRGGPVECFLIALTA